MKNNNRGPRILLADDFPPFLEEAGKLLRNDHEIVGFARDGGEALKLCLAVNPDILLLDLSMPILCGLEVATRLKELGCRSKIIFVTGQEDQDYVDAAFSLGAFAYVLKYRLGTDLLPAIHEVLNGSTFTSPFPARVGATSPEHR
jgi:DNA-binding NarL/FixJ family response regulator